MKTNNHIIVIICAGLLSGCAAAVPVTVPRELLNAREAYLRVSTGVATLMAPEELQIACRGLVKAEQSFQMSPNSYQTRDLAYIAERQSRMAEITAFINIERGRQMRENRDFRKANGAVQAKSKESQKETKAPSAVENSELTGEMTEKHLFASRDPSTVADQRETKAWAALSKLVEVKQEQRGMVIFLSGSSLFAYGQSDLLPEARSLLDPVIDVLLNSRDRSLTIEAHTDSEGFDNYNMDFSQRRANAVRDYLVQRDYRSDHIQSHGLGEGHPIADNTSAEGRAKNRRVEIIIERESLTSNKK